MEQWELRQPLQLVGSIAEIDQPMVAVGKAEQLAAFVEELEEDFEEEQS